MSQHYNGLSPLGPCRGGSRKLTTGPMSGQDVTEQLKADPAADLDAAQPGTGWSRSRERRELGEAVRELLDVVVLLIDHAMGCVAAGPERPAMTVQLSLRYRRPTPIGVPLTVAAQLHSLPRTSRAFRPRSSRRELGSHRRSQPSVRHSAPHRSPKP